MDESPDCGKLIDQETKAIYCSICKSWLHKLCFKVTDEQYTEVTSSPEPFYWRICISENLPANLVSLGNECVSEETLSKIVADYLEINSNYHDLHSFNSIMSNRKPDDICIFHINIRSLRKNIDELSNMLSTMQKPPHIVAVSSETKINKNDGLSFPMMVCHFQLAITFYIQTLEKNQVE